MTFEIENGFHVKGQIASEIGGRDENQDSAGATTTAHGSLIVVCDGMGGMGGGAVASSVAVHTIIDDYENLSESVTDDVEFIRQMVTHANQEIIKRQTEPGLSHMGTTLVLLLVTNECAYTTYVGDSRVYLLRGMTKVYRTFDHSAVFERVRRGELSEEAARQHPNSNVILQALGVVPELNIEVTTHPYARGDRFVLCTDGIWGTMPENQLLLMLSKRGNLSTTVQRLMDKVELLGMESGGHHDNYTIAMIDITHKSLFPTKMRLKDRIIMIAMSIALLISIVLNGLFFFRTQTKAVKGDEVATEMLLSDSPAISSDHVEGQ